MYKTKKMLLLGSGELGKEVIIEAQRLGVETVAVDRYADAPAMHVAHRHYVIDMLDGAKLREVIEREQPDLIVPEIEALATSELVKLEEEGFRVIPTARAAKLTMDREGIRRLASEKLGLPTAGYRFADNFEQFEVAVREMGFPCVIKPLMSSSGKGQSVCRSQSDIESCWNIAMEGGRVQNGRVIIEEFITFQSEITLLTVRSVSGTSFCPPIGHVQESGDYIESWQPHPISEQQMEEAERIARAITDELGGFGLFGVELFLTEDQVYFSEVSPRPHDTGLVTLVTQNLSEFALHVRAILGYPIPEIVLMTPGASRPLKAPGELENYKITGAEQALAVPNTQVRLFGKPVTKAGRRVAVALSTAGEVEEARSRAKQALDKLGVEEG
ncbi:formate-dependent phosphoribosylglycinamide formyltransferase [Paenibacillus lactis]|uniref:formate-dependent phosphoribosylglycinamide formyltransferase n=1 Tax=Paenibacillus lactis TaxID=228574 RepID=UPI001B2AB986|nr:formate-dependent phosphoribosylglycinamide formyltransferase [Paenibacillus lactis]MCM3491922.1 formate-dependent phosphoribosylglycinamide formyltransferase [Paenibacillus lactis]GIO92140.1 phosphoribosylglycinamide formyltransferase 2 [Paenibacillus lactis]